VSSAAHSAAVIARAKGSGAQVLSVHDGRPTSPSYPYVIVHFDSGIARSDREADERIQQTYTWQTTTVGLSAAQCRDALDRVTDRLENWVPVVTGRTCTKVQHESSQPVRVDESLPDRVLFYATDQWSTVSDPV
jgi:hypothetical protein